MIRRWWLLLSGPLRKRDDVWLEQLLPDESPETVMVVRHHWAAHVRSVLYAAVALLAFVLGLLSVPYDDGGGGAVVLACMIAGPWLCRVSVRAWRGRDLSRVRGVLAGVAGGLLYLSGVMVSLAQGPHGLLFVVALVAGFWSLWLWEATKADVLFVTEKRVFKLNSFLSQTMAAMPLRGLVDLTVHEPWVGRVLGYGHFTFESAAQRQGLDEFRVVGDVLQRSLEIQDRAYGGGAGRGGPRSGSADQGGDGVSDVRTAPEGDPVVYDGDPGEDTGPVPVVVEQRPDRRQRLAGLLPQDERPSRR